MSKVKAVIEYLEVNPGEAVEAVRELNSWNGSFDHLEAYPNDEEFFEIFFENKPAEAVRAACYGTYEYNDEYVRFDGYGNLESMSEYQLEKKTLDEVDAIAEELIENFANISLSDELEAIIEEDEDEEEEE